MIETISIDFLENILGNFRCQKSRFLCPIQDSCRSVLNFYQVYDSIARNIRKPSFFLFLI